MVSKYKQQVLDDFIHLTKKHGHQTQDICQYFIKQRGGQDCDVLSCEFAIRHHRAEQKEELDEHKAQSTTSMLYADIMDSLHVYIHHLYQFGLRIEPKQQLEDITDHEDDRKEEENKHFDAEFWRTSNIILNTRKNTKSFERFGENVGKYNISAKDGGIGTVTNDKSGKTHFDELKKQLSKHRVNIECIERLQSFMKEEEYDTEALSMDIDLDSRNSNTAKELKDDECVQQIYNFTQNTKRMCPGYISIFLC